MPILEINILGSNIEISYQEGEKEKLLYLVKQFKLRLSKFENLKLRFADFKIILLAALKAEDIIYELKQTIDNKNKVIESSSIQQEQIDNKIREIVKLKDELFLLNQKNKDLEEQNNKIINEIEKLNNQLISFIDKIVNTNKNDN